MGKKIMEQEGIKTDYLVNKIKRLEQSLENGKLNKDFVIELIKNFKEYNIQSDRVIEDCEAEIFYLKYLLEKIQNDIDHLAKLLQCLGVSRMEMTLCSDASIDYIWENADKKNIENIYSISCLLRLASDDGVEIKTPQQLKKYIEHGN